MAKELPYFKFEPSEWENGLIQMCSRESKGLFIDIISIYWQRLGNLSYRYALQKLCGGNADALQELIDESIIKNNNGNIVIHFLDDQLKDFNLKSKKAADAANARWEKHNETNVLDADALRTHSERNAIREEKRREENNAYKKVFNFRRALIEVGGNENLVDDWLLVRKRKKAVNSETAFRLFINEVKKSNRSINEIIAECAGRNWQGFKAEFLTVKQFK